MRSIIEEIIRDKRCSRLEGLLKDPTYQAIANLSRVWGIGEKTALDLYKIGYKTVDDLRNRAVKKEILNSNQLVGLRLFDDLQQRIPREEVGEIYMLVKSTAESLCREMMGVKDVSGLQVEVGGLC